MTYRVIQWATGNVGRAAVEGVLAHPDLELVGAYVYSDAKAGRDVGDPDTLAEIAAATGRPAAAEALLNSDAGTSEVMADVAFARQVGIKKLVVFINKVDMISDKEMLELVDMEMRDLLSTYNFDGEETPIVMGSALAALEGRDPEIGEKKIVELVKACDEWLEIPPRKLQ